MSFGSPIFAWNTEPDHARLQDRFTSPQELREAKSFLRAFRFKMRFGELTRTRLRLLRFELQDNVAQCDWLARPADQWDAGLGIELARRHASQQALKDAIAMRALLFKSARSLQSGDFRVYRDSSQHGRQLIATGRVERTDQDARHIRSLAMRAKLLGFKFTLEDEVLIAIPTGFEPCYA